jgi:hypothetical protein
MAANRSMKHCGREEVMRVHSGNGNSGSLYSGLSWPADQYSEATINSMNATGNVLVQVRQSSLDRTGYEL